MAARRLGGPEPGSAWAIGFGDDSDDRSEFAGEVAVAWPAALATRAVEHTAEPLCQPKNTPACKQQDREPTDKENEVAKGAHTGHLAGQEHDSKQQPLRPWLCPTWLHPT
jgi:hypothetical protein